MAAQVQQSSTTRKFQACGAKTGSGCGKPITIDKAFRGQKGGWIPLEEVTDSIGQKSLQPHNCPAKPKYNNPTTTTTAATTQDEQQLPIPQKPDTEAYNVNLEFETVWATIQRLDAHITELEKRVSRIEEK